MAIVRLLKDNRREQYRAIVETRGVRFIECAVLAFTFPKAFGPEKFHYELMYRKDLVYYLFDAFGNTAQVVVPDEQGTKVAISQIAEICGGTRATPNFR